MDILISFGIIILMFPVVNGDGCTFHRPCSCEGDNYNIDLSPIMKHNKDPLYVKYGKARYYLDPCGGSIHVPACTHFLEKDTSGCQLMNHSPYGIAKTTGYTASGDPEKNTLVFTYSYGQRITKMKVVCSDDERKFLMEGENPPMTYNFLLKTKYACTNNGSGLSIGSILVIVFFSIVIVYLVGGILFLKCYRKKEGVEIFPNHLFWAQIPVLVKEGFVFVIGKVRGVSTYENIA